MRPLNAADSAFIARLHNQRECRPWTEQSVRELLEIPMISGIIDDGIGYVIISRAPENAEIVDIAVDESQRGHGHGERLLRAAMPEPPVFLEVAVDNQPARALYEKIGFKQVGLRPNYYDRQTHRVDAIVMALK